MPNVELHDAITLVPGITGAAGYHALLTSNEGARFTWYVPSMSGRTAEIVAAVLGFPVEALVIDVWTSQGIGNAYSWNAAALATAGVTVAAGATAPSLEPAEGGYLVSKTWLRFGGHDYLADSPFDVVIFEPSFAAGVGARALSDVLSRLIDGTYGLVRQDGGPVQQGSPSTRLSDVTLASLLLAVVGNLSDLFGIVEAAERLRLILSNFQIGLFSSLGERSVGTNPEIEIRSAMLDALEAAVGVIDRHFANAIDSARLVARVVALRTGQTSGVVTSEVTHDHLTMKRWRLLFAQILLDVLALYSLALG